MPEFAPEFQEISQDIQANLYSAVSEVEGHDLHQSEELLLDATKQLLDAAKQQQPGDTSHVAALLDRGAYIEAKDEVMSGT